MHDRGGERKPLFPAAGKRAGELVLAVGEAKATEGLRDNAVAIRDLVKPGDEVEVLADGEVFVEREALGHVADFQLDAIGLADHVVAEAGAAAGIGTEQAAEHADGRGLARAVRPEESDDLAAVHVEIDMIHHHLAREGLGQVLDRDDRSAVHDPAPASTTSTGWPTFSAAASPSGLASMR